MAMHNPFDPMNYRSPYASPEWQRMEQELAMMRQQAGAQMQAIGGVPDYMLLQNLQNLEPEARSRHDQLLLLL